MKRKVKVRFMDYWNGLDESYLVLQLLRKHYDVEICDDADYVFFSVMGESHWSVPDRCIKIIHTGENLVPDFNACDYAIGFDWMELGDRYIRFPLYLFYKPELLEAMCHKHEWADETDPLAEKTGFCSFVVSNPLNDIRNEAFRKLSEYKRVDSGGRFQNNVGGPVADKLAFESKHKFSLCFENGSHSGYTTEKLVEAFGARTIPIYWGDPDVGKVFNTKAFVNVNDYASLDEALARVRELDQDGSQYLEMLREPALLPDAPTIDAEIQRLTDWLRNIFDQPLSEAGRRNRDSLGNLYIRDRRYLYWQYRIRKCIKKLTGR